MDQCETWHDDDIEDAVCGILADVLGKPAGMVRPDSPLDEGLGVDSLALIETQVEIEERFGIALPDVDVDEMAELHSVRDLVRPVAERIRKGADHA